MRKRSGLCPLWLLTCQVKSLLGDQGPTPNFRAPERRCLGDGCTDKHPQRARGRPGMSDRAAETGGDAPREPACRLTDRGAAPIPCPLEPQSLPSVCGSSVTRTQPQRPPRPQGNPGKPRAAGPALGWGEGQQGRDRGEPARPPPPRSSRPESRPPTRPACSSLTHPARLGGRTHTHTPARTWVPGAWSAPPALSPSLLPSISPQL